MAAIEVARLVRPGKHAVGVVPGLHLLVKETGAKSWVLRVMVAGRRRDVGLGGFPAVTLAQAREAARAARDKIRGGVDPVEEARLARSNLKASRAAAITFQHASAQYIKAHGRSWRNEKHRQQWKNTLATYADPLIGDILVSHLSMSHVLQVLEPIWFEKTETASRLRGRIESILDWAKGRGYRSGDNPAAWKGNLDTQLPKADRVARQDNQPALPIDLTPEFMRRLRRADGQGARALEFTILTVARSGEARGAGWSEIDMEGKVWTIPASRMKAGVEHRVPLSSQAIKLLKALPRVAESQLVFPAPRGAILSDMTLTAVIRRFNEADKDKWVDPRNGRGVVPHGFRSTFRDWAAERTNFPREVAEMALAHTIDNKVEAAYRRGDLFEKRRLMMNEWASFLE
ncbi:tyrosine-type recombinase/integrase [Aquabacterium sp.]|uniref:tyrosine-type recombinase/integrase n=1 Tax=Aquabacterium sp. TaxID=1872578 RepID=UPI002BEC257C|nr:integrase arm-type DNA-binding domain-containing protein [Aquabacterium sp.]HSW07389.1 integrase arm-type DNA-binding domain-containing protein [Aquabacterium sp.]